MEFLSGFGLALLVNIFVIVGRDFGHLIVARVFMAFLISVMAYLLVPFIPNPHLHLVLNLQAMVPALFWLVCQFAFNDRPRLKNIGAAMAVYSVIAPTLARYLLDSDSSEVLLFFGWTLGELFEYGLLLHGLWIVVSNWSNDLVESRRKLRIAMLIIVGGSVSTAVITLNLGLSGEYTRGFVVSISALIISFFLIKGRKGVLFGDEKPSNLSVVNSNNQSEPMLDSGGLASDQQDSKKANDAPDSTGDAEKLLTVMADGFYRTENLTLKVLARHVQLPEYKVRNLINQVLGYRNFNDYINQLRITDASQRLIETPSEPILNISLDVGYRSISSFNRAFKDIVGVSPSTYRQHKTLK